LSIYSELKRRNVFRVAAGYVVLSWVLLQVADVLMDTIGLPDIWGKAVLGLLVIGFPPVLIFSWIYEMTPEGIKREKEIAADASITSHTAKKLNITVIVLLVIAIGIFAIDKFTGTPVISPEPVASTAPSPDAIPVVAVLPLQAFSTEEEGIFLASGLHDDLLTRLARLQSFKVISRTSVMEYADTTKNLREIGAELGASYILEGGLQAIGGNVRINAQLIDAVTDEHLWAQTYNRALTTANLFDVQADIAGAIAGALHATLSPQELEQLSDVPTENLKAYEAYLRGLELRGMLTMPALHGAVAAQREATELDPEFGEAWASLSVALIRQYWEEGAEDGASPNEALVAESQHALERAQQLDPDTASTFVAESYFHYYGFRDYSSALIALGRAEALAPNNSRVSALRGYLLRRLGRLSESSDALLRAMELNPNGLSLHRETIDTLKGAGRCEDVRTMTTDALQRFPDDDGINIIAASAILTCNRDTKVALKYARKVDVSTMQQLQIVLYIMIFDRSYESAIEMLVDARGNWVRRPTVRLMIDNRLTWLYRETGQQELAAQAIQSARKNAEQISDSGLTSLSQLMILEALDGNVEATRRFGSQAMAAMPNDAWRNTDFAYRIGKTYALAGLTDEAFSILEDIRYDHGYDILVWLLLDPFVDNLRDDPRYQQILDKGEAEVAAALMAVRKESP
jgi:TolB-like protein